MSREEDVTKGTGGKKGGITKRTDKEAISPLISLGQKRNNQGNHKAQTATRTSIQ